MHRNKWRTRPLRGALLLKLICTNKYAVSGRLEALMISPACCRRRDSVSDLLHPLADHPETLTFSYACCDAAPPASFPLDRMSMKEPLSLPLSSPLPTTCFHTLQAKEPPFHGSAAHLKCPVAEHMHLRWSAVFGGTPF